MPMTIQPTGATLGAIITDVSLADLSDKTWLEIETAFYEYALLIFPGQHLTEQEQNAFAARFGEIELLVDNLKSIPISNRSPEGEILEADSHQALLLKGNEGWHTDSSYMPLSAKASVLSAHVVPPAGGQTEWADPRAAYDALDAKTRERIKDLAAYHSFFYSQGKIGHNVEVGAGYGFFDGEPPLHPLVKTHAVTGRAALYIGRHIASIVGLEDAEAKELLAQLMAVTITPEQTYLHEWSPGDLAVWDNRCVLHRARDYDRSHDRLMLHTRVKGDPRTESALNAQ